MARKPSSRSLRGARNIDTEEARLWEKVTGDVARLDDAPKRVAPVPDNAGRGTDPARTGISGGGAPGAAGEASSLDDRPKTVPPVKVRKSEPVTIDRRNLRKIGKGRILIDDRIDLHGMRQTQAHQTLLQFLRNAQLNQDKTVLVITGKGRLKTERSENWMDDREPGVLRREVPNWLRSDELEDVVLGFSNAHPRHGGDGALYVRLKRG